MECNSKGWRDKARDSIMKDKELGRISVKLMNCESEPGRLRDDSGRVDDSKESKRCI